MTAAPSANGRFQKGNPGGPGNPFAARVMAYRRALMDAVSEEDLQGIARTMVKFAQAGDVAAAKLIIDRTAGKPIDVAFWRSALNGLAAGGAWAVLFEPVRDLVLGRRNFTDAPGTPPSSPPEPGASVSRSGGG